jgi:AraC-like DNA-binding protein
MAVNENGRTGSASAKRSNAKRRRTGWKTPPIDLAGQRDQMDGPLKTVPEPYVFDGNSPNTLNGYAPLLNCNAIDTAYTDGRAVIPTRQIIPIPFGYQETIVTPRASRRVEAFWSYASEREGRSLILPDGRCDIMLRFKQDCSLAPKLQITGPATKAYVVEFEADDRWIGVRFRPESAGVLWGAELEKSVNLVLHDSAALKIVPHLSVLERRDLSLAHLSEALESSGLLNDQQSSDDRLPQALDILHTSGGRVRIDELAAMVGCSSRHLNRLFRSNIGIQAKTYGQIAQFHRALQLISDQRLSIADAAYEAGYADQAHLTRKFRQFGGFTPKNIPLEIANFAIFA